MPVVTFHDQEHLLNRYRESGFVLIGPVLPGLLAIFIPWYYFGKYGVAGEFFNWLLLWTCIISLVLLRTVFVWWLNRYLVTDKRLIKIAHVGLFKKVVVETPLERILNVSYKTTGILSAIGRYGEVEVQVVGLVEPIILNHISHPAKIKDYLWDLHQKQVTSSNVDIDHGPLDHLQDRIGYTKSGQKIL